MFLLLTKTRTKWLWNRQDCSAILRATELSMDNLIMFARWRCVYDHYGLGFGLGLVLVLFVVVHCMNVNTDIYVASFH